MRVLTTPNGTPAGAQPATGSAITVALSATPVAWATVGAHLSACAAGGIASETDTAIDELADYCLTIGAGEDASAVLAQGLALATGPFTRRAAALASCAGPSDPRAVDALVHAYRGCVDDAFLAPAMLEALGYLARGGGLARSTALAELQRLDRSAQRSLLVKAAKVAGRLDAAAGDATLRGRLEEWRNAGDPAVQGECRQQLALMLLTDALLAPDAASVREHLFDAGAAFVDAEATEEHRPDAALFRHLLDAVLALWELSSDSAAATAQRIAGCAAAAPTLVSDLHGHDWHGYHSPRAEVVAACVVSTTRALEVAAASAAGAQRWTQLDAAVVELASLHATIREGPATLGTPSRADRLDAALGAVADVGLAPALGPVLRRWVGSVRLETIIAAYEAMASAGSDVGASLRSLVRHALGPDRGATDASGSEINDELAVIASRANERPVDLIRRLRQAVEQDRVNVWAATLGLAPVLLPIDLPGLYGNDPAVNETVRRLLKDLRSRLGSDYPRDVWEQLAVAIDSVVRFARHTHDTLPSYTRCVAAGGMGPGATERNLQDDLFRWLEMRFGLDALYERSMLAGGRSDTGLRLPGCEFPIEVKHEHRDVSRAHIRTSFIAQSDTYAGARNGVAFLPVLDLRESNTMTASPTRSSVPTAQTPVSLYSLYESFWIDALPPDPQIEGAREKAVIVGLFPGNRPLPSGTTAYSRRSSRHTAPGAP